MEFWAHRNKGGSTVLSLLAQADRVAARAHDAGALVSIPTRIRPITDHGIEFSVRIVGQLARKAVATTSSARNPDSRVGILGRVQADSQTDSATDSQADDSNPGARSASSAPTDRPARNPFLPYEPALFVADLPPHHVCLLNKFNVVDRHLLLVTRHFASQCEPLDAGDFAALAVCLAAADGLGFYNGGPEAGASQRHKHLQWIPVSPTELPLAAQIEALRVADPGAGLRVPSAPLAAAAAASNPRIERAPTWPFRHRVLLFDEPLASELQPPSTHANANADLATETSTRCGIELERHYRRLLDACGLEAQSGELPPYNLLVTRRWMLLVPRRCECAAGISYNALAFAGALLVKDESQWESLRVFGPWQALLTVTFSELPQ